MATANTKATAITNADAQPKVFTPAILSGAYLREAVGTVEVAAADDDGSVYRFARIRSSARMSEITVFNDAITAGTSYDVGLYRTAKDGGAVVDADLFASALDLSSASAVAGTQALTEATATNIDKIEKQLWQLLGLSADPMIDYDLCLTGNTVGTAAGTISVRTRYVIA